MTFFFTNSVQHSLHAQPLQIHVTTIHTTYNTTKIVTSARSKLCTSLILTVFMFSFSSRPPAAAPTKTPIKVAVVGGSIGGLAAATAFLRLGATVRVFEKVSSSLEGRGSSLGFVAVDLWDALTGRRMIRRGRRASRAQGAFLYGDLWSFLAAGMPDGTITFGTGVTDLGADPSHPTINGEVFDLAIVAEGSWSSLRTRYFGPEKPKYAGWQAWRFRVPLDMVPDWDAEGQYDVGHYFTILMKIAKNDGTDWIMGGTGIACPEEDIKRPELGTNRQAGGLEGESTPSWFLPWFKDVFGRTGGGELYRAMEAAAMHGKITPQPQYEFCASQIVKGRIVLVGDAAHTAVPRTAAGAHTAVLDGMALFEAFRPFLSGARPGQGWDAAIESGLAAYEPAALERARSLYSRSLEVSVPVLPPGWSREASWGRMTAERAAGLSIEQLRAELMARRVSLGGLKERSDYLLALMQATGAQQLRSEHQEL